MRCCCNFFAAKIIDLQRASAVDSAAAVDRVSVTKRATYSVNEDCAWLRLWIRPFDNAVRHSGMSTQLVVSASPSPAPSNSVALSRKIWFSRAQDTKVFVSAWTNTLTETPTVLPRTHKK